MAYSPNLTPKPNFEIPEGKKKQEDKLNRLHTKHSIPYFFSDAGNALS